MASGPTTMRPIAASTRQDADRERVPAHLAAEPAAVARGPGGGQAREGGERDRRRRTSDDRHALEVAREADTAETLPAASVVATRGEEQERQRLDRVAEHLGQHQADELAQRGHPQVQARADPDGRVPHADDPDAEVQEGADDRADRGRRDAEPVVEQQRAAAMPTL